MILYLESQDAKFCFRQDEWIWKCSLGGMAVDYYELKRDVYEAHAADVDTLLMPLHVLDGTETFLEIQQRSVKMLEFCQEIEQPLTGRIILLPELWVTRDEWKSRSRQWGRVWLKPPFRVLLFVKSGAEAVDEPLSRWSDDAAIYLADTAGGATPVDAYQWLLKIWSSLPRP